MHLHISVIISFVFTKRTDHYKQQFLNIFLEQFCSTANVQRMDKAKKNGLVDMNENIFTLINY